MSREAYLADARNIVARAQSEAAADMKALQAKHEQRLREVVNAIQVSAQRNGVQVRPSGFVLPNVTQVLTMGRPNQVYNISY
jgi:hypothetical protein